MTTVERKARDLLVEFTDNVWDGVHGYEARQNLLLIEFEEVSRSFDELGELIESIEEFQIVKLALG